MGACGMGVSTGESGGGGIYVGECGGELGGVVVGVCVGVHVGVDMRVPVVPGLGAGRILWMLLPVLRVWQQVGASGFWRFGLPTLPLG